MGLFEFSRLNTGPDNNRRPYMTRICFWRLRLHIFYRGDEDENWHDHPWNFWTFPLNRTGYIEEVLEETESGFVARWIWVKPFRFYRRDAKHIHKILGAASYDTFTGTSNKDGEFILIPAPDPTKKFITLVFRGKLFHDWGFYGYDHDEDEWRHKYWKDIKP